ncbi:uncharacterized protein TNCV_862731 [Trichonephila clavipes]|nr:uncharacterized protein TNCV_862731 [Trichonephila clavipes]
MAKRNLLDDFKRGRMIGNLVEGRSLTIVAEEFGINKSVIPRTWKAVQTIGTAVRKVGGDRHRKTTAVDDLYIAQQTKRARYQSVRAIAQQVQQQKDKCRGLLWLDAFPKVDYSHAVLNATSH